MEWVEPIFDRTQSDIDFAIQTMRNWRKTGLTETSDLKGCFNVSDINRIENDIQYLSDNLTEWYYFNDIDTTKTWDKESFPTIEDVNRIINNIRVLITAYFQSADAPALPETIVTFEQVNALEENLYQIKAILDDMIASFRVCSWNDDDNRSGEE